MATGGKIPAEDIGRALLSGFVAAATGALVFTGVNDWPGLEPTSLSLPGLPDPPRVRLVDMAWCTLVGAVAAAIVVAVRRGALLLAARVPPRPTAALVVGGLVVGGLAVAFRAAADRPVDLVLFSGQAALPEVLAESSAGVLVLLLVAKALAYGLSLGVGFRGGPVFPALVLGVALGMHAELVLPGLAVVPAIVRGRGSLGGGGAADAVLRRPGGVAPRRPGRRGHSADRDPGRGDRLAPRHGDPGSPWIVSRRLAAAAADRLAQVAPLELEVAAAARGRQDLRVDEHGACDDHPGEEGQERERKRNLPGHDSSIGRARLAD